MLVHRYGTSESGSAKGAHYDLYSAARRTNGGTREV